MDVHFSAYNFHTLKNVSVTKIRTYREAWQRFLASDDPGGHECFAAILELKNKSKHTGKVSLSIKVGHVLPVRMGPVIKVKLRTSSEFAFLEVLYLT